MVDLEETLLYVILLSKLPWEEGVCEVTKRRVIRPVKISITKAKLRTLETRNKKIDHTVI